MAPIVCADAKSLVGGCAPGGLHAGLCHTTSYF